MGFEHEGDDAPDTGEEIRDWSTLVAGRAYRLRSGVDVRRAVFLRNVDDDGALFEFEGGAEPEPVDRAEWDVFPASRQGSDA